MDKRKLEPPQNLSAGHLRLWYWTNEQRDLTAAAAQLGISTDWLKKIRRGRQPSPELLDRIYGVTRITANDFRGHCSTPDPDPSDGKKSTTG